MHLLVASLIKKKSNKNVANVIYHYRSRKHEKISMSCSIYTFVTCPLNFFVILRALRAKTWISGVFSNSHVFHSDILKNLAVVDIPDRLVIPDLGRQEDGSQHDTLPVGRANVDLGVGEQPLQIHLDKQRVSFVTSVSCLIRNRLRLQKSLEHLLHFATFICCKQLLCQLN